MKEYKLTFTDTCFAHDLKHAKEIFLDSWKDGLPDNIKIDMSEISIVEQNRDDWDDE